MFIVCADGSYGEEFYGQGETIEEALKDIETKVNDYDDDTLRFYKAEPINVEKTVKYNIVD